MADFSVDSLDAVQAGGTTADTLKKLANDARNAACGFFHAYPHTIIPNPGVDFLDGLWDGLCQNSSSGNPPPPTAPFSGGQCRIDYLVHYTFQVVQISTGAVVVNADNTVAVSGDIRAIYLRNPPDDSVGIVISHYNPSSGMYADFTETYGAGSIDVAQNLVIVSITPISGSDDCGNPPPTYPPDSPPPAPTVPGGTTYNLPSVNLVFNSGLSLQTSPTLDLGSNFAPVVNLGGLNVSFGGGGATVAPPPGSPPASSNQDVSNLLKKILGNLGDGTLAGGGVGGAAASAAKNTTPPPKPGSPGTNPPVVKPPEVKTSKNLAAISAVEIIITSPPQGDKEIFASDPNYNVYIAGWFSWLQGDLILPRMPIQYLQTIWFAPPGADGYTYTLAFGAEGYAVESTLKPTP